MNTVLNKMCINCKAKLKKQTLGLNVLYYCPHCGIMTTANTM